MTVTIEQLTINFDGGVILLGGLLIIVIIWLLVSTDNSDLIPYGVFLYSVLLQFYMRVIPTPIPIIKEFS